MLKEDLQKSTASGPELIEPKRQLLSTIWLLSTPDSYRSICGRFDMAKSSLFTCFVRVVKALNKIAPRIIKWPSKEEAIEIQKDFCNMSGLQGVIGAIDGTYIAIKAPSKNREVCINRKCLYGLTLQAICDSKRKFTDVFTGYPSSVSDIRIFKNSPVYKEIIDNPALFFEDNQFILGDKAYPILKWCIPPFVDRGTLQRYHKIFNSHHAKTRQVIERAFGLLFGRFRRLKYLDMNRTDSIPQTITAACVLHNIYLMHPDKLLDIYTQEGMRNVRGNEGDAGLANPFNKQQSFQQGSERREYIAHRLPRLNE